MMNYQKYLTAMLYAVEVPIGVWAGFEFGTADYLFGGILTVIMMALEIAAVITWMDAQTIELEDGLNKQKMGSKKRPVRR